MAKYLVDVNLPYYFSLWEGSEFIHQADLCETWSDERIWNYAEKNNLTIITKDADFSARIIMSEPPPKVIHLKISNMKLNHLYNFLSKYWKEILELNKNNKLVNVYKDKLYSID